jgi:hypothetical protein
LEKGYNRKILTESLIQESNLSKIRDLIKDKIYFLEDFTFTGLYNNIIDFESKDQKAISTHFSPTITLPTKTLLHLSFLQTLNLSPRSYTSNRSYHFLHLTYQEYFAARYFVRQ